MSRITITIDDRVTVTDRVKPAVRKSRRSTTSVTEVASSRGVSRQRVLQLLAEGRIPGAYQTGGNGQWVIPSNYTIKERPRGRRRKKQRAPLA